MRVSHRLTVLGARKPLSLGPKARSMLEEHCYSTISVSSHYGQGTTIEAREFQFLFDEPSVPP